MKKSNKELIDSIFCLILGKPSYPTKMYLFLATVFSKVDRIR